MVPTSNEIIDVTKEILSQPEFQQNELVTDSIIQKLLTWLVEQVPLDVWTALFFLLAGSVAIYLTWMIVKGVLYRLKEGERSKEHAFPKPTSRKASKEHQECIKDVKKALEANDSTLAIKKLHAFFLCTLERKGLVTRKKWKTNVHYLVECQLKKTPLWETLRTLSHDFDLALYGKVCLPLDRVSQHLMRVELEVKDERG